MRDPHSIPASTLTGIANHLITAKYSVYNTLAHRAKVVSSNPTALSKELDHIRRALQSCLFPTWVLNRLQHNFEHIHNNNRDPNQTPMPQHQWHHQPQQTEEHFHGDSIQTGVGRKVQKGMQQMEHTGTLQRNQHHQVTSHGTYRQRQQTSEKWGYFQVQVPTNQLS